MTFYHPYLDLCTYVVINLLYVKLDSLMLSFTSLLHLYRRIFVPTIMVALNSHTFYTARYMNQVKITKFIMNDFYDILLSHYLIFILFLYMVRILIILLIALIFDWVTHRFEVLLFLQMPIYFPSFNINITCNHILDIVNIFLMLIML